MAFLSMTPLLAQSGTDESLAERVGDFFTGDKFAVSLGIVLAAVAVWYLFSRVGRRAFMRIGRRRTDPAADPVAAAEREQRLETLWVALRRLALVVVLVVTALTLLAWWAVPITPFLAVGTVVGVALGFGAQDLVRDVIAGFFIISENQFTLGDVVRIAGVSGRVEEMRLRVTVLRDLDGQAHYVPNGKIDVATNLTQEFASVVVDVGVAYGQAVDRALEVLKDEAGRMVADSGWAEVFLGEAEVLGVQELGESAVVMRVAFRVRPDDRWRMRREFLRRIKNRLDAEGISIPFPHRTLVPGDAAAWREALGP